MAFHRKRPHAIYKLNRLIKNNVSKIAIFITCLVNFLKKVVVDFEYVYNPIVFHTRI